MASQKRLLESSVMVANGRPLKDVSSSASVVRRPERTPESLGRDCRGARSDFLEMNNVGKLRSLQDVIEDKLGAWDEPKLGGLDVPRCEGKPLLAHGVCWARRRPLGDLVMRVAQRYGRPAMGGMVKGRKSTVESVEVEEHRGACWDP